MKRTLTTDGWIALGFLVSLLFLIFFVLGTTLVFNPKVAAISAAQATLQGEVAELQEAQATMLTELAEPSEPDFTQYEITDELLKVVALENSSCFDGALDVATVIINRLESGLHGDTIHKVLSEAGQFTTYSYSGAYVINNAVREACYAVCTLGDRSLPSYVMYFATRDAYESNEWFCQRPIYAERYGHVLCY